MIRVKYDAAAIVLAAATCCSADAMGQLAQAPAAKPAAPAASPRPTPRTFTVAPLSFEGQYVRNQSFNVGALSFEGLYVQMLNKNFNVAPLSFEGIYVPPTGAAASAKQAAPTAIKGVPK
jgi:hypothetical protein